ncbi:MAG: SPOR domain-containing protein [Magnetococcales bacterium]|nr:SPOR domain-containing protein [Magnetococcales bacterium]
MPPIVAMISRFVPHILCVLLAGVGLVIFVFMPSTSLEDIWRGSPMPGKRLALPDPSTAVVVVTPPPPEEKVATPAVEPAKKEAKPEKPANKAGYIVHAGTFLDLGINVAMDRLRKSGLEPWEESIQEMVPLNDVQAGPFDSRAAAKQAEAQLKAAGITAKAEETWEGFIISLSQSFSLGEALQELERAKSLGISTVRLVKIEAERTVRKIYVGPFSTKYRAKEISARVAKLGLAVPIIKEWVASDHGR